MQTRQNKRWDPLSALLLVGALLILALRLVATDWTDNLDLFVYLTLFAAVAGICFGISRFSGLVVSLFGSLYGIFFIVWTYGITLNRDLTWYDRVINIMGLRLNIAIEQYATNIMVTDPILFLAVLAILFWIITFASGFVLTRKGKGWLAILPPGVALMIISYYDLTNSATPRYIFFFILFTLLLIGRTTLIQNIDTWKKQKISPTPKIQADMRRNMIIFIVIVLTISWMIPLTKTQTQRYSEFWTNLTKPWQKVTDKIADALEPLRNSAIGAEGSFDATLSLGTSTTLGGATLFTVTPDGSPTPGLNLYWKVRSYNLYNDDMWMTSNDYDYVEFFPQRFKLDSPVWLLREEHSYSFFMNTNQAGNFYYVNSPAWVSRQVEFVVQTLPDGKQDVIAAFGNPLLQSGETYEVQARIPNPTISELRSVEPVYPTWMERYTQLPENFPTAIKDLALQLTADLDNPYDKTQAITQYLRDNITYASSVGTIPLNVDPIEWFLFEKKSGFCNFYATAEVLMLRSIGIPARVAVGYAQGEFDPEKGGFAVRQKDKHAWPEVYFNQYGWIEFEPTVSITSISRPLGTLPEIDSTSEPLITPELEPEEAQVPTPAPTTTSTETVTFIPAEPEEKTWVLWIFWFGLLLAVTGLSLLVWRLSTPQADQVTLVERIKTLFERSHSSMTGWLHACVERHSSTPFSRAYSAMEKGLRLLGNPAEPSRTPAEVGQKIVVHMPEMKDKIAILVEEYEKEQFSPHASDLKKAREASLQIKKTAQYLRLINLFKKKDK